MTSDERETATAEFVRLLGENERRLRAFVLSLVPHWADADEIVQQTRVRVWEQFDQYDRSKDFGAWTRSIAYYLVLAHRKKSSRLRELYSPEALEAISAEFDASAPLVEARSRALKLCLEKLEQQGRKLIARYYAGNETMGQISVQMGITENAVKLRIARLRVTLAKCIRRTIIQEGS